MTPVPIIPNSFIFLAESIQVWQYYIFVLFIMKFDSIFSQIWVNLKVILINVLSFPPYVWNHSLIINLVVCKYYVYPSIDYLWLVVLQPK